MRILRYFSLIPLISCFSFTSRAQVFPLHTSGVKIVDANGTRVRFTGVNWYGAEGTDYVVTGLQYNTLSNIARLIKQMGFNVVRIPWSNQLYETNPVVADSVLTQNPGLQGLTALQIMDKVIDALGAEGLMVIIDDHESTAGVCCGSDANQLWYNSSYPESSWLSDWEGMATRYASRPWVIGVDLRNEPRGTATWTGTGSASFPGTDWESAAQRGGNAVLGINPKLLIFVEGIRNAGDLSGVGTVPVALSVVHQLIYEAHDYSFYSGGKASYTDWVNYITPLWGYLSTGPSPQPLWIGEFGTCHTDASCTTAPASASPQPNGVWWGFLTHYITANSLDWTYWPLNGTAMSGNGFTGPTQVETYGILNSIWNSAAESQLSAGLAGLMAYEGGGNPATNWLSANDGTTGSGTNQFNFSSGWSSGTNSLAYDGDNHWSSGAGNSYSVAFDGTQALVYNAESSVNGIASITVDGGSAVSVDNFSGDTSGTWAPNYSALVYASPILANGPHLLTVLVTGTKNANATSDVVTADRVDIVAPAVASSTTSMNDSSFGYSGTWSYYAPQAGAYMNDNHYSAATGSSYRVSFTGSSATLFAATAPICGIANVSVDGATPIPVDLYASTTTYQTPIFTTFQLSSGSHTITVTVSGGKNSNATGYTVTADRLDFIHP